MNTIAKHITKPYKNSTLDEEDRNTCNNVGNVVKSLQKFVAKLRSVTLIRESLGTALTSPVETRWLSHYSMITNFFEKLEDIRAVLTSYRQEFLPEFNRFSKDPSLIAYQKVLAPLQVRITMLEVSMI